MTCISAVSFFSFFCPDKMKQSDDREKLEMFSVCCRRSDPLADFVVVPFFWEKEQLMF